MERKEFLTWLSMTNFFVKTFIVALIAFLIFVSAIFISGNTFGQICAEDHAKGTPEWNGCVENLSKGGNNENRN